MDHYTGSRQIQRPESLGVRACERLLRTPPAGRTFFLRVIRIDDDHLNARKYL